MPLSYRVQIFNSIENLHISDLLFFKHFICADENDVGALVAFSFRSRPHRPLGEEREILSVELADETGPFLQFAKSLGFIEFIPPLAFPE